MARSHDQEEAAAQAVRRVVGGTWELNDTGAEPNQVDVLFELENGQRLALEVTSEGPYDVPKARSAMKARTDAGDFAGASLSYQWLVHIDTKTRVSTLEEAAIEAALLDFERQGLEAVSSRGASPYGDPAAFTLARLRVESVVLWDPNPPNDVPKIVLASSFSVIGGNASLPEALQRVLARTDNQDKLAAAEADQRHLYIRIDDRDYRSLPSAPWRSCWRSIGPWRCWNFSSRVTTRTRSSG
jgi:hypothetical protein